MINRRGQAMTEMVLMLPVLLTLAAAVCGVVYMCAQGINVQQAANLAARIQGQERVAGGVSLATIEQDNGIIQGGDPDPGDVSSMDAAQLQSLRQRKHPAPFGSVYGKIQRAVHDMFAPSEQPDLFVPMPHYGTVGFSDQVKVVRVWDPPKFFNLSLNPFTVTGTAYGGEDSHMYGLVRWGSTSLLGGQKFWAQNDPKTGTLENLPNPNND